MTTLNANTPRGLSAEGTPQVPSAFEFVKVEMINAKGETRDIRSIVTEIAIAEDLYSPVLICTLSIRDDINFFEEFNISGKEIINLQINKLSLNEPTQTLKLTFVVKDYPIFQRTISEISIQEYSIIAISAYAYLSRLQTISQSVKGNPIDNIKMLFKTYMGYSFFDESSLSEYPCTTPFKGVITKRTPLQAVKWCLNKAFDKNRTPFFTYATIAGMIKFDSYSAIVKRKETLGIYEYRQNSIHSIDSVEYYNEQKTRILDIVSNLKLNKLETAIKGGLGNKMNLIDYSNLTYQETEFSFKDSDIIKIDAKYKEDLLDSFSFLDRLGIDSKKLVKQINPNDFEFHYPYPLYNDSTIKSSTEIVWENMQSSLYYKGNMESASHEISVYGDFKHNPGKKIDIRIPKATQEQDDSALYDKNLSGVYIVAAAIHSFKDGTYINRLKLIKDSTGV